MRIVSGLYGGRRLLVPKGRDIRPTSDKVRGAIFNMLRSRVVLEGACVMDCFCGTGALGLEALSQGAASCVFLDKSRESLELAKENAAVLGAMDQSTFILKDAAKISAKPDEQSAAGLLFLDPPYRQDLILKALVSLQEGGWINADAFIVLEAEKDFCVALPQHFLLDNQRVYGDTKVILLRYAAPL